MSDVTCATLPSGNNSLNNEISGYGDSSLGNHRQQRESLNTTGGGEVDRAVLNETQRRRRTLKGLKKQGFNPCDHLTVDVLCGGHEVKSEENRLTKDSGVLIEPSCSQCVRHLELYPGCKGSVNSQRDPERSLVNSDAGQVKQSQHSDSGQEGSLRHSNCCETNGLSCPACGPGELGNGPRVIPPISVTLERGSVPSLDEEGEVTSSFHGSHSALHAADKGLLAPAGSEQSSSNPDSGISDTPESGHPQTCFDFSPRVLTVPPSGYVDVRKCQCSAPLNCDCVLPPERLMPSNLIHGCHNRSGDTSQKSTIDRNEMNTSISELKRKMEGIVCDGKMEGKVCDGKMEEGHPMNSPFNQGKIHALSHYSPCIANSLTGLTGFKTWEATSPKMYFFGGSTNSSPFYLPSPPLVSKNNLDQLTRELLRVKDVKQSLTEENEKLNFTIQNLYKTKSDLEESCSNLNDQLARTDEKVKTALKEKEEQSQELDTVKMEKMSLEQKFQDQAYELKFLKEKVEELERELSLKRQN